MSNFDERSLKKRVNKLENQVLKLEKALIQQDRDVSFSNAYLKTIHVILQSSTKFFKYLSIAGLVVTGLNLLFWLPRQLGIFSSNQGIASLSHFLTIDFPGLLIILIAFIPPFMALLVVKITSVDKGIISKLVIDFLKKQTGA